MQIKLGNSILCAGQTRNSNGNPVGPEGLQIVDAPGVEIRSFVGADRVQGEHVKCDSGTISFAVTRTFASVADALHYVATRKKPGESADEAVAGQLAFVVDGTTKNVFGPNSVVTSRSLRHVGCTVAVNYTIQG